MIRFPENHINDWALNRQTPNNFDFLRFFFAVLVIYGHSYFLLPASASSGSDLAALLSRGQLSSGYIAVNAFFAISGFLVLHSYLSSKNNWLYLKKRVMRIYPGFVFNILVSLLLFIPLAQPAGFKYFKNFDFAFTFYNASRFYFAPPHMFPGNFRSSAYDFNDSLWSISYEFKCYLIVILLGFVWAYRWRISLLLLYLFALILVVHDPSLINSWQRLLVCYLSGMTFYYFRGFIPRDWRIFAACVCLMLVAGLTGKGAVLALDTCGVYALMYLAFSPQIRLSNFGRHGDFSYGIYLYSLPIQQLLIYYSSPGINPLLLFVLATPVSLAFAWCSWVLVEKPFLSFKENTSAARHGIAAVADLRADASVGARPVVANGREL